MSPLRISARLAVRFIAAHSQSSSLTGFSAYPGAMSCLEPRSNDVGTMFVDEWRQDATDTQYAYTASNQLDSGATGQLAIEYWFRPGLRTLDPVHAVCSRGTGNGVSTTQFVVGGIDTQYGSNSLTFGMYNSTSGAWVKGQHLLVYTDANTRAGGHANLPMWSHAMWIYNGAGATDADRLKLYLDGVAVTLSFTGTGGIPATMASMPTAEFRVGQSRVAVYTGTAWVHYLRGHSAPNSNRVSLGPLRIWTSNVTALPALAAGLFNSGKPKRYTDMTAAEKSGCLASYEWRNNLNDSSPTGLNLTPSAGSTQKYARAVLGVTDSVDGVWWHPRWGGGDEDTVLYPKWPQYAINGGANTKLDPPHLTIGGLAYALAPTLDLTTGAPLLECRGSQHLERPIPDHWFGQSTYEWWHTVRHDFIAVNDQNGEPFGLNMVADINEKRDNYHLLFMAAAAQPNTSQLYRFSARSRKAVGGLNEQDGTTYTVGLDGVPHIARMRDVGTGLLITVRTDGIDRSMVRLPLLGAAENDVGLSGYTAGQLTKLMIHAAKFADAPSGIGIARYGVQWIGGPKLDDTTSRRMEQELESLHARVGHGRNTTGGSAGDTYVVTTVTGGAETSGTLAYGIANAPAAGRTITFSVAGTTTNQSIVTSKSNITIDGSTAPGNGFCFRGSMTINGSNWIIKDIRIRTGRQADPSINQRPLLFLSPDYATNGHITDFFLKNVSVSWGNDEAVAFSGCANVTVQNCLIGEPLYDAFPPVHTSQSHSCLAFYRCERVTCYQNVFVGGIRTPLVTGKDAEIINNVIFGVRATPAIIAVEDDPNSPGEPKYYPIPQNITSMGNLGLYSSITQLGAVPAFFQTYMTQFFNGSTVYLSDNKLDASWSDGVLTLVDDTPTGGSWSALPAEPSTASGASSSVLPVGAEMLTAVLAKAGAIGVRDAVDTRLIGMITGRASAHTNAHPGDGTYSTYLIADEDDVGGYPVL